MSLTSLSSLSDMEEIPRRRRKIPDRETLFTKYEGEEFRVRYSISKDAVLQLLNIVNLKSMTQRNKAIDSLTQLLICLRFFATGCLQQMLEDLPNVHKSTVVELYKELHVNWQN